jgi:hypothetical protein
MFFNEKCQDGSDVDRFSYPDSHEQGMVVSAEFHGCYSNETQHQPRSFEVVGKSKNQKPAQLMKEVQFDKVMCTL